MPIRIYALSKELNIDSKELVDICAKAGVTGKGSALASLTDEEVTTVKAFLAGGRGGARAAPGPRAPGAPREAGEAPAKFTKDDYIAPGGVVGKPPVVEAKVKTIVPEVKKKAEGEGPKPASRKEPVVRVGAMPTVAQPDTTPKSNEPAPQEPIIKLPPDAIRGAKAGTPAPLKEFTSKHAETRKAGAPRKPGDAAPAARAGAGPVKVARGDRRRPGKSASTTGTEEGDRELAGMASARATRRTKGTAKRTLPGGGEEDEEGRRGRRGTKLIRRGANTAAPRKGKVVIELPCTVRSFSEASGIPTAALQKVLMGLGTLATVTAAIDPDTAQLVAGELGIEAEFRHKTTLEESVLAHLREVEDLPESLVPRPPVVTFLGHVDHGKTSLLDRIIGTNVVAGEAGGITQHIRAYQIEKDGRRVSFVDTPGHEAFTEMRARGANVTDIAVLVVAADDGVMPQTEEALSHARAAGVPIVVALNKTDLPGAKPDRVLQQLSAHGLLPTEWGGEVEVIRTSAITGAGMDTLLETLLLTADIHDYRANPDRTATGTCLEAQQDAIRGVTAKVIVQNGTLRVGDIIVCGSGHGRVKAMYDTLRPTRKVKEAGPSMPVNITGLDIAPQAGQPFYVLDDIAEARQIADSRAAASRAQSLSGRVARVSFDEFQRRLSEGDLSRAGEVATLNLILRADTRGSIEAILKELSKLEHPEVQIKVLQATVGAISVADVTLADASDAVIVGFNVIPDEAARALAEERGVEIRRYDIIYQVTDDLRALLEGKLKPEKRATDLGRALVQRVFTISRIGTVAGCRVLAGTIQRGCRVRVNREGRGIGDYPLDSLRREKDDVREVREGMECGMKLAGFNDLKEGDVLEAYKIEEVARTF